MKFTDEARELWDQLSDEDKRSWTEHGECQKCHTKIDKDAYNASVYEGNLALFHECVCGNKEVRLVEVNMKDQKAIDDDFEAWKKAKLKAREEKEKRQGS